MANEKPGGEKISKAEADKMKKKYQEHNKDKTHMVGYSATFIRQLVNDTKADTVWLAFGEDDNGDNTVIVTVVDANNQTLADGDRGQPCPPYCADND